MFDPLYCVAYCLRPYSELLMGEPSYNEKRALLQESINSNEGFGFSSYQPKLFTGVFLYALFQCVSKSYADNSFLSRFAFINIGLMYNDYRALIAYLNKYQKEVVWYEDYYGIENTTTPLLDSYPGRDSIIKEIDAYYGSKS